MSLGQSVNNALPFSNVVAGQQATSVVRTGKTIETLQLQMGGTTFDATKIDMFRLKANAKTIYEGTGVQIDKINKYRNLGAASAAFLDVAFQDLTGMDAVDRAIGALDTSNGVVNLTTEVNINAAAAAPTLSARVFEAAPQMNVDGTKSPLSGLIAKQLSYAYNTAAGGTLPLLFPFGKDSGAVIKRVHVFHANMTGAIVKEDRIAVHESLLAQNQYEQVRNGRAPQAGMYTIDFVLDGSMRNAFDTRRANSVEWLFTFSAADSGNVVIEYLDVLGNL